MNHTSADYTDFFARYGDKTTITTTNITLEDERKAAPPFKSLNPKNIIFNNPATIIYWDDGTKTVVKIMDGDVFDEVYGVAMCYMKKIFGSNTRFKRMIDGFILKNNKE